MRTIIVDEVMSWKSCKDYTRERVEELWSGKTALTLLEIARLDIPPQDILWALLRNGVLDDRTLRLLACDYAEYALMREREQGREPHPDSWRVVEVSRRYANGEATDNELAAAWAAWDVAGDTAWDAARDAERKRQISRLVEYLEAEGE